MTERRIIPCNLRAIRKLRGFTAADIADALGHSTAHQSHLETGKRRPSLKTALAAAHLLHVGVSDIWRMEDLAE